MSDFDDKATISGAIVAFENGADDVPTKSLVVTIPPTLSGVSSVTETKNGKNFIPLLTWYSADYSYTNVGITFKVLSDGGIRITGKTTATYSQFNIVSYTSVPTTQWQFYIPKGQFTFSLSGITDKIRMVISGSGNNGFAYSEVTYTNQSRTGTVTDDTKPFNYVILRVYPTDDDIDVTVYPQCEVGSTATAYEPYVTPTQYTASLGRTILGGTADIVNGVGSEAHQEIDLGSLSWVYASASSRFYANLHLVGIYTNFPTNANEIADITCADYETITFASLSGDASLNNKVAGVVTDAPFITIRDTRFSDANAFKNAVTGKKAVIPLATPTDFTFTGQEVPTRLGCNTFWSEQGDTEITYYKSGYGYTSVTVNQKDGNDELIATKTAKLHKVIYGGEVDVIKGTAEPKNLLLPNDADSSAVVVNGVTRSYSLDSQTFTFSGTNEKTDANWLIFNGSNFKIGDLVIGDSYTFSHNLSADCYAQITYYDTSNNTRALVYLVGKSSKDASITFTVPSDFKSVRNFQIGVVKTATSVSEETVFQLEKGSSPTDYVPHFEPFTFTPISMETAEGTNVLYANEGDSTVTYRKSAET